MDLTKHLPIGIFVMTPSLEGWLAKAKEAPSAHEVRMTLLDVNPVFQCLWEFIINHPNESRNVKFCLFRYSVLLNMINIQKK